MSSDWAGGDIRWARRAEEDFTGGRRPWGNPSSASEVESHGHLSHSHVTQHRLLSPLSFRGPPLSEGSEIERLSPY